MPSPSRADCQPKNLEVQSGAGRIDPQKVDVRSNDGRTWSGQNHVNAHLSLRCGELNRHGRGKLNARHLAAPQTPNHSVDLKNALSRAGRRGVHKVNPVQDLRGAQKEVSTQKGRRWGLTVLRATRNIGGIQVIRERIM